MPTNYSKMDLSKYRTAQEMWDDMSEVSKAKKRRQYPAMSDKGIRNYLWRRRDWEKYVPDKYPCKCNKIHKNTCPNAQS